MLSRLLNYRISKHPTLLFRKTYFDVTTVAKLSKMITNGDNTSIKLTHQSRPHLLSTLGIICVLLYGIASTAYADSNIKFQSINDIQLRLNAAQSSDKLSADQRDLIVQLYQKTIDNLALATEDRNQAQRYIEQIASAPSRLADLQRKLDQVPPKLDMGGKLALLEKHLLDQQTTLSDKRYYKDLKYGYARGLEAVRYVKRIRNYEDIIKRYDN